MPLFVNYVPWYIIVTDMVRFARVTAVISNYHGNMEEIEKNAVLLR